MYVIANKTNAYLVDVFRACYPDVNFVHKYENFNDILESGLVISKDSVTFSKKNGINIKRKTKVIVIITNKENLNSKKINKILELYGNMFHIYVDEAEKIKEYYKDNKIDTFEFRNYLDDIFEKYIEADYLMIDIN